MTTVLLSIPAPCNLLPVVATVAVDADTLRTLALPRLQSFALSSALRAIDAMVGREEEVL